MLSFSLGHMQSRCSVLLLPHRRVLLRPVGYFCELINPIDHNMPSFPALRYISYICTEYVHVCLHFAPSLVMMFSAYNVDIGLVYFTLKTKKFSRFPVTSNLVAHV